MGRESLFASLRWQLWLRLFALVGIVEDVMTLVGGNWFGPHRRSWELSIMHWQLTNDHAAKPRNIRKLEASDV